MANFDAGGVVCLVDKRIASTGPSEPSFCGMFKEIIPGRVVRTLLSFDEGRIQTSVFVVHNFGFTPAAMRKVEVAIRGDINKASLSMGNFASVVLGDFNLPPEGEHPYDLKKPIPDNPSIGPPVPTSTRPFQARWEHIFKELTEVKFTLPTHLVSTDLTLNRIDRIFTTAPRSALAILAHSAGVIKDPVHWHAKGLSDHAPICWVCSIPQPRDNTDFKLKKEWCSHPKCRARVEALWAVADTGTLGTSSKRWLLFEIMRDSASRVRNFLFLVEPNSESNDLLRLGSIARALWTNDAKLAHTLIRHTELGKKHLEFDDQGRITLARAPATSFELDVASAKRKFYDKERQEIQIQLATQESEMSIKAAKRTARIEANLRKSQLWDPSAPKLVVCGLRILEEEARRLQVDSSPTSNASEVLVTGKVDMMRAMGAAWVNTFTAKPFDPESAAELLGEYTASKTWNWGLSTPPTRRDIATYILSLKDCEPGLDGICNAAWRNGGEPALEYAIALINDALSGRAFPHGVNFGKFVFIPKGSNMGEDNGEENKFQGRPLDMRPLTLKASDNKIVAGVINLAITPTICQCASALQRGFIPGRQLGQNVVDLDWWARKFSMEYFGSNEVAFVRDLLLEPLSKISMLPVLVLFDFAAAFPSVAHAWLRAVLSAVLIPQGVLNAFNVLYDRNQAFGVIDGLVMWLFEVGCGVLTGCPLSGSLFVLAMDPLLFLFEKHMVVPERGAVFACADDVGAALKALKFLFLVEGFFRRFEKVSGLKLKPVKCNLVPLTANVTASNARAIANWLARYIPGWMHFQVCDFAKYLGLYLGPAAANQINWDAPVRKFCERVEQASQKNLPLQMAASQFNTKAVTVLGYVGQFVPPPQSFKSIELRMAHKVLNWPTNSLDTAAAYSLEKFGGPKLVRPAAYILASRVRAATKTFHGGLCLMHSMLEQMAEGAIPVARLVRGCVRPPGWLADAFCTNLLKAREGSLGCSDFVGSASRIRNLVDAFENGTLGGPFQRHVFQALVASIPNSWPSLLSERAVVLGLPSLPPLDEGFTKLFVHVSKRLLPMARAAVLKTWTNGWCTSTRCHEVVTLNCVFGCGGSDSLAHYLICDPLWTIVVSAMSAHVCCLSSPPEVRACLVNPSRESVLRCLVAFQVYHALKISYRRRVDLDFEAGDYTMSIELAFSLAQHFASECM